VVRREGGGAEWCAMYLNERRPDLNPFAVQSRVLVTKKKKKSICNVEEYQQVFSQELLVLFVAYFCCSNILPSF
jgi:hypothetical protein